MKNQASEYYSQQDCNEDAIQSAKSGTAKSEKESVNYSIKSKDVKGAKAC